MNVGPRRFLSLLRILVWSAAVILTSEVHPAPLILEESARIALPDSRYGIHDMALSGERIVIAAARHDPETAWNHHTAWLFERRSNGDWVLATTLYDAPDAQWENFAIRAAMEGDTVALATYNHVHVFERNAVGWVQTADLTASDTGLSAIGSDVEIDSGTLLVGGQASYFGAAAFRKNATGEWTFVQAVTASPGIHDSDFIGGDVDISGNTIIVASPAWDDPAYRDEVHIFEGPFGAAQRTAILSSGSDGNRGNSVVGSSVAVSEGLALVGSVRGGVYMFQRTTYGYFWEPIGSLQPGDLLTIPGGADYNLDSERVYVGTANDDRGPQTGSIDVYQRSDGANNGFNNFPHIARLMASDASATNRIGGKVSVSGNRVAAGGTGAIYIFDLPEDFSQPELVQEDLQDGYADNWTPLTASLWSVVPSGGTNVYRQTNLVGDAGAVLDGADWTNQAIEADAKALAFASAGQGWFGMFVRYTDASNFYYLTVRNNNTVQIRKMVNGSFQPIASAPLTVATNRPYRLRLEAVGSWLRAYVNSRLVAQAIDSSHSHGQAGLTMSRARAEYDNILVSPNPSLNLLEESFEDGAAQDWMPEAGGAWTIITDGTRVYRQASVEAGDARSIADLPGKPGDQIIEADAKALAFAPGDRWFGLAVRYLDADHYHYVTIRSGGSISLRKFRGGSVTVLDSAPMKVTTGAWYKLRFEAIGRSLRVYVNNQLVLEGIDDVQDYLLYGKAGVMTYKASAQYDNVIIRQP